MLKIDLDKYNKQLKDKSPKEIVLWALKLSNNRMLSTSFGMHSAALIHLIHQEDKDIKVIWCDTGFNNEGTYIFADDLIKKFELNVEIYSPLKTTAFNKYLYGKPTIENPNFHKLANAIKLEPFKRAIKEVQPKLWFTNIRKEQTEYRNSKNILSYSKEGILKVSPFYFFTNQEIEAYIVDNELPKNINYFDPIKINLKSECGIQLQ